MEYREKIKKYGFIVLENIFTKEKLINCKYKIIDYVNKNKCIKNCEGLTIPDFIKIPELIDTENLKNNFKLNKILEDILSKNYRFCQHNDIGINRQVGWHKDKLNGHYEKYETKDIWTKYQEEEHEIVKVLIYLEDHSNDDNALKVVPKSHMEREIITDKFIQLKPKLGDVVIFDQRITHRGAENAYGDYRILVSFGFGKNNIFTDNFEKGTIIRQNDQNKYRKQI
tara:strand:- start:342 stop:1019 length:678 start_codon:yes stop_codon:yes gene_type:complete